MNSFASTANINPEGVLPILTIEQVWKGLNLKIRNPKAFVPMITSCEIVKDEGNQVIRKVKFGEEGPFVTEEITSFEPTIAYFEMSTGIRITNLISYSSLNELLLTFSFANGIPGITKDSNLTPIEINERINAGVKHSIDVIRQLVVEGKI